MKIQENLIELESLTETTMLTHYPPPQSDFGYPQQGLPSIDNVEAQSWFSNFLQPSPEGDDSMLMLRSDDQQSIHIPDWLSGPVSDSDQNVSESSLLALPCPEQEGVLSESRTSLPPITEIQAEDLRLISAVLTNVKEELSADLSLLSDEKLKLPASSEAGPGAGVGAGKNGGKLPGFHQAFGSTEIGRFSQHEEYFEAPQEEDCLGLHNDLMSKVSPVPVSAPTSRRGRGARNGTRRTKAQERKQTKAAANNQLSPPQDPAALPGNEPCKPPAGSGPIKMEKKDWEMSGRDCDSKLSLGPNQSQNQSPSQSQSQARSLHESSFTGTNGFVPPSPSPYYNQTRQDRFAHPMHHNSYYNPHYCPPRSSQIQERFVPGNPYHFQGGDSGLQPYQSSQCWNQFNVYSAPSNAHQSYSGMMSYSSPACDVASAEYKSYYYNNYSNCTEFDYQNYGSYHFQQRSHPYRRMSYQSQPALPSFNNDRLHYNM
ncbi:unnamed protein product [Bemisia tabaci]|uniref:Uncharacterized protein n=1 Tax=Bemisia tabaci TaxID=7038 RepID=A0A9P0F2A9_BEMTA|nr:unnamed protein product [Bemisia tabaci]